MWKGECLGMRLTLGLCLGMICESECLGMRLTLGLGMICERVSVWG